jgi:flavodoxin
MAKEKILVAYYSRNGHTKKIATEIANRLNADIDEIIDLKDRSGITGWLGAGKDALFRTSTIIRADKSPEKYDKVIIGTPVWAGKATPAIREYLKKKLPKRVAFFCTYGVNPTITFSEMERISKIKPLGTISVQDMKIIDCKEELDKFCKGIK